MTKASSPVPLSPADSRKRRASDLLGKRSRPAPRPHYLRNSVLRVAAAFILVALVRQIQPAEWWAREVWSYVTSFICVILVFAQFTSLDRDTKGRRIDYCLGFGIMALILAPTFLFR